MCERERVGKTGVGCCRRAGNEFQWRSACRAVAKLRIRALTPQDSARAYPREKGGEGGVRRKHRVFDRGPRPRGHRHRRWRRRFRCRWWTLRCTRQARSASCSGRASPSARRPSSPPAPSSLIWLQLLPPPELWAGPTVGKRGWRLQSPAVAQDHSVPSSSSSSPRTRSLPHSGSTHSCWQPRTIFYSERPLSLRRGPRRAPVALCTCTFIEI